MLTLSIRKPLSYQYWVLVLDFIRSRFNCAVPTKREVMRTHAFTRTQLEQTFSEKREIQSISMDAVMSLKICIPLKLTNLFEMRFHLNCLGSKIIYQKEVKSWMRLKSNPHRFDFTEPSKLFWGILLLHLVMPLCINHWSLLNLRL